MEKHRSRYIQLGLNIAYYRKLKGLTQLELSEIVHISRTYLSNIESPNMITSLSIGTLFDIADALGVAPVQLFDFRSSIE